MKIKTLRREFFEVLRIQFNIYLNFVNSSGPNFRGELSEFYRLCRQSKNKKTIYPLAVIIYLFFFFDKTSYSVSR
jgi:hypothetical protein